MKATSPIQTEKQQIFSELRKQLLILQGFKGARGNAVSHTGLGVIEDAFPNACFPTSAIHEFIYARTEDLAASEGFLAGILAGLMRQGGACVWINAATTIFPPGMKAFGIDPERIVFANVKREKEVLWAVEEALKCEGLAAVIGEIPDLSFAASRRLQLAVEQSRVTGFLLRQQPRSLGTTACIARWRISPVASHVAEDLPGPGFQRWKVELLRARNGHPGIWHLEWSAGRFRVIAGEEARPFELEVRRKAG